jgi:hypothetical protein
VIELAELTQSLLFRVFLNFNESTKLYQALNKNTRLFLTVIGILSIVAGVYSYFVKGSSGTGFSGIFIGIALIGAVYINFKRLDK